MIEFTTEQQAFLTHSSAQHACLLAGPGNGKSTTVIEYASRLSEAARARTRFITFTRAATAELAQYLPEVHLDQLRPSTFHSFAISILLRNRGMAEIPEPIRVMGDWEWDLLVRPRITRLLKLGRRWRDADELRREMAAKWESLTDEESAGVPPETRAQFVSQWQQHRERFGYTELSEVPFLLYSALRSHPDIDIGELQLLIVDEFQDLNACDLACLQELAKRSVIIFAVGDDDQSIYGFRKAHPAGIRDFPEQYGAPSYPLTTTRRFGSRILEWANHVINFDSGRAGGKPTLKPHPDNPEGHVAYLEFRGHAAEVQGIVSVVRWLHEVRAVPLDDILVMGRTARITSPIIQALQNAGIRAANPDVIKLRFRETKLRATMSLLRLICDPTDSLSWWNLLDLTENVGSTAIDSLVDEATRRALRFGEALLELHKSGSLQESAGANAARRVAHTLELLQSIEVPDNGPWGEWITVLASEGILPSIPKPVDDYLSQVDELLGVDVNLDRYIGQIYPVCRDIASRPTVDAVRVMSMTASKGLTIRASIVAGCESNIVPHPRGNRDEECRLLYVAMTRPCEFLFLTRALRRTGATARTGRPRVRGPRTGCPFLEHGPVTPVSGDDYIASLFSL